MFLSRVLQADSCKEPKLRSLLSLASVQQLSTCRLWCSTSSDQETTQQRLGDQTAASEVERRLILDDHSRQTVYCESKTVSSQPFAATLCDNGYDQRLVVMLRTVNMGLHLA